VGRSAKGRKLNRNLHPPNVPAMVVAFNIHHHHQKFNSLAAM
jgi:hypothetical protein